MCARLPSAQLGGGVAPLLFLFFSIGDFLFMKIDFDSTVQQTKTELDEKFFSIADPAFIFDLLRNKIYSNPIAAVCRELTCNALDAHREVGTGEVPVVVNLPNHQEPYFKVKDFGPGISPERIDDIYLKYAASTKRNTNDQIGAFGIGAKSPFSYSDSFTIVTNVNGKCYNYAAFIDESRIGKLILLSESETADPNGTEIIVPVKPADFSNFVSSVEKCTRHWKVKPKFTGDSIMYLNVKPVIESNDWFISADKESYYSQGIKVLVGEIEYALDSLSTKSFADISILNAFSSDLYLKFSVGEVSLAANRESIFLDPATKQKIKERLVSVKSDFTKLLKDRVESCPSLWEANCLLTESLHSMCRDVDLLDSLTWRGMKIQSSIRPNGKYYSIWEFSKDRKRFSSEEKISRRSTSRIACRRDCAIIIHDCGVAEPTSRHVKNFFLDLPEAKNLFVVVPNKQETEAEEAGFDLDQFISDNDFDQLGYHLLSKHNAAIRAKKVSDKVKLVVYKFDKSNGFFAMTSLSDLKADTQSKVFSYLSKDSWRSSSSKFAVQKDKATKISNRAIKSYLEYKTGVAVYGVDKEISDSRINSTFGTLPFLEDCINQVAEENGKEFLIETLWMGEEMHHAVRHIQDNLSTLLAGINDTNGIFYQFCVQQSQIKEQYQSRTSYISMMSNLGKYNVYDNAEALEVYTKNKPSLSTMWEGVTQKYPLIKAVNYNFHEYATSVIDYINMIDAKK